MVLVVKMPVRCGVYSHPNLVTLGGLCPNK